MTRLANTLFLVIITLASGRIAFSQDNINCGSDFDSPQNCGGCDYGYYTDGSCEPPADGGGSGGGACAGGSVGYMSYYADQETDDEGTLYAWETISNNDGNAGESRINASVSLTMPDGTTMEPVSATTSTSASLTVTTTGSFASGVDNGQGSVTYQASLTATSGCGTATMIPVFLRFRISVANYQFAGYYNGGCQYALECGTTTATCGAPSASPVGFTSMACPLYLYQQNLVINDTCIYIGHFTTGSNPVSCS